MKKLKKLNPKKCEKEKKEKRFNTCPVRIGLEPKAWKTKKKKVVLGGRGSILDPPPPIILRFLKLCNLWSPLNLARLA